MRFLTYNVLCQAYLRRDYYPQASPEALQEEPRRALLLQRLRDLGADVLCLQEVDRVTGSAVEQQFPGYSSRYLSKTGGKPDGCQIVTSMPVRRWDEWIYRDGSGHVALLAELDWEGGSLWVANTHLKWDRPGKRSWGWSQMSELLARLKALGATTTVLCGDLNLPPEDEALSLPEAIGLRDAHGGHASAVVNGKAKKIDYLLISPDLLAFEENVVTLEDGDILPSLTEPSDHVPLMVEIRR